MYLSKRLCAQHIIIEIKILKYKILSIKAGLHRIIYMCACACVCVCVVELTEDKAFLAVRLDCSSLYFANVGQYLTLII